MSLKDKLEQRLNIQAKLEGEERVALLRVLLRHVQTENQWLACTNPRHLRYGEWSYQTHVFYDIQPWVENFAEDVVREILT